MWEHWNFSGYAVHPLDQPPSLDPGMQQAFTFQRMWKHDLASIRKSAVDEVEELIELHQPETLLWWQDLPEHIQKVYFDPDHNQITQILLLLDLLQLTGFPGLLHEDLMQGFAVTGKLHAGTGWTPRTDEKYSWPMSVEAFKKLQQGRPDPHWRQMLEELLFHQTTGHTDRLNAALQQGMKTLLSILADLQPRTILFFPGSHTTCLFTDAYFVLGERHMSPGDQIPAQWNKHKAPQLENGWGFVCRLPGQTVCGYGRVPPKVLKQFCGRRAFIYFLEIAAQLFSLVLMRPSMTPMVISFIDNQAGLSALTKGFGRDPNINNLLGLFWRLVSHFGWRVHLAWVSSENNISDKVSRQDDSDMPEIQATRLSFDLQPLFDILCKTARSLNMLMAKHYTTYFNFNLRLSAHCQSGESGQCGRRLATAGWFRGGSPTMAKRVLCSA